MKNNINRFTMFALVAGGLMVSFMVTQYGMDNLATTVFLVYFWSLWALNRHTPVLQEAYYVQAQPIAYEHARVFMVTVMMGLYSSQAFQGFVAGYQGYGA